VAATAVGSKDLSGSLGEPLTLAALLIVMPAPLGYTHTPLSRTHIQENTSPNTGAGADNTIPVTWLSHRVACWTFTLYTPMFNRPPPPPPNQAPTAILCAISVLACIFELAVRSLFFLWADEGVNPNPSRVFSLSLSFLSTGCWSRDSKRLTPSYSFYLQVTSAIPLFYRSFLIGVLGGFGNVGCWSLFLFCCIIFITYNSHHKS